MHELLFSERGSNGLILEMVVNCKKKVLTTFFEEWQLYLFEVSQNREAN